jgi:hypothetical protein
LVAILWQSTGCVKQAVKRTLQEEKALEEQRNGEWRYLEFLQVTSLITAEIFMREIPDGMRAR